MKPLNQKTPSRNPADDANSHGKPGPEPARVKIHGDWEAAVKKALRVKPPVPVKKSKKPKKP